MGARPYPVGVVVGRPNGTHNAEPRRHLTRPIDGYERCPRGVAVTTTTTPSDELAACGDPLLAGIGQIPVSPSSSLPLPRLPSAPVKAWGWPEVEAWAQRMGRLSE